MGYFQKRNVCLALTAPKNLRFGKCITANLNKSEKYSGNRLDFQNEAIVTS